MTRPKCNFKVGQCPNATLFKPDKSLNGGSVYLTPEEIEALRLKNIENLEQTEAADIMGVSQSTFQRVLMSAYKKISEAIVNSKSIELSRHK